MTPWPLVNTVHCALVRGHMASRDRVPLTSGHSDLLSVSSSFTHALLESPTKGPVAPVPLGSHHEEEPGLGAELCAVEAGGSGGSAPLQPSLTPCALPPISSQRGALQAHLFPLGSQS